MAATAHAQWSLGLLHPLSRPSGAPASQTHRAGEVARREGGGGAATRRRRKRRRLHPPGLGSQPLAAGSTALETGPAPSNRPLHFRDGFRFAKVRRLDTSGGKLEPEHLGSDLTDTLTALCWSSFCVCVFKTHTTHHLFAFKCPNKNTTHHMLVSAGAGTNKLINNQSSVNQSPSNYQINYHQVNQSSITPLFGVEIKTQNNTFCQQVRPQYQSSINQSQHASFCC